MSCRDLDYPAIAKHYEYDPATGTLWRKRVHIHQELRLARDTGERFDVARVTFQGRYQIKVTHVIWMLMTHRWPTPGKVIDHIDRNVFNCQWSNLREATQESARNRGNPGRPTNDDDLERNVYPSGNRYRVRFDIDGCEHSFGTYATREEASAVARRVRAELHGEYAYDAPQAALNETATQLGEAAPVPSWGFPGRPGPIARSL